MNRGVSPRPRGFSLLEMLVASAIATMTLLALYHASGGSVRVAAEADLQTRALIAAESLLALHQQVGPDGVDARGRFDDGLHWEVRTLALTAPPSATALTPATTATAVHAISVRVRWQGRGGERQVELLSAVPEVAP